jgi:hypothetical protein
MYIYVPLEFAAYRNQAANPQLSPQQLVYMQLELHLYKQR